MIFKYYLTIISVIIVDSYYNNKPYFNGYAKHKFSLSSSSGAAVEVKNVYISIGNNDIMSDVNWIVMPGLSPNANSVSLLMNIITLS